MKKVITHASLFSGIGAPELAAFWMGWQNVFHCEISKFCNTVLNYWYPDSISYENIKTTDFSEWQGRIDVLTGGFPCQPFSSAGQRRGADDDRYLWPEMLRTIRQVQPAFVIGENVAGILSMVQPGEAVKVGSKASLFDESDDIYRKEQQFVVETVCTDLEREGYAVQPFVVPACSVGAPHQRDRVWFIARRKVSTKNVADTDCCRCDNGGYHRQERQNSTDSHGSFSQGYSKGLFYPRISKDSAPTFPLLRPGLQETRREFQAERTSGDIPQMRLAADTKSKRRDAGNDDDGQPQGTPQEECSTEQPGGADCPQDWWRDFPAVSPVCRGNDGLPFDISRLTVPFTRWLQEAVKALGNSMVPQVVFELFRAIEQELI